MMRKPNFLERVDEDIKYSYVESDPVAMKSLSVLKGMLNVSQEYHYFRPDMCVCAALLSISETYTGLARRKPSHGRDEQKCAVRQSLRSSVLVVFFQMLVFASFSLSLSLFFFVCCCFFFLFSLFHYYEMNFKYKCGIAVLRGKNKESEEA